MRAWTRIGKQSLTTYGEDRVCTREDQDLQTPLQTPECGALLSVSIKRQCVMMSGAPRFLVDWRANH